MYCKKMANSTWLIAWTYRTSWWCWGRKTERKSISWYTCPQFEGTHACMAKQVTSAVTLLHCLLLSLFMTIFYPIRPKYQPPPEQYHEKCHYNFLPISSLLISFASLKMPTEFCSITYENEDMSNSTILISPFIHSTEFPFINPVLYKLLTCFLPIVKRNY